MDQDTLRSLVLDYLVGVLTLANRALELVDDPDETALTRIQELVNRCGDLEASAVPLILAGGASWETMASQLGVAKQSLNRRLSRRSARQVEQAGLRQQTQLSAEWKIQVGLLGQRTRSLARNDPARVSADIAQQLMTRATVKSQRRRW
jgi:hypothetical protein